MASGMDDWVHVNEVWQMSGTNKDGQPDCIKFVVLELGIYRAKGKEKTYPGAKIRYEDGKEEVLCLSQFAFFDRLRD